MVRFVDLAFAFWAVGAYRELPFDLANHHHTKVYKNGARQGIQVAHTCVDNSSEE